MAKPIEIGIASETKAFKQGIETGVVKPVEDADKALEALGKNRGPAKLEDALEDAQKATDHLKDETHDTANAIERDFKNTYASVRNSSDKGMDGARGGLKDFKQEAASTGKEAAASFGGIEDAGSAVQEALANVFVGFGPAAAAAGLAGAVALGLVIAAGEESADAINEAKERSGELAQAIVDAGGDIRKVDIGAMMREWGVEIADNKEWWELWQTDAVNNLEKAQKAAKATGTDFQTMFRAMSGQDPKAAVKALDDLDTQIEKNWDRIRELQGENFLGTIFEANGIEQATKELEANRAEIERNVGSRQNAIDQAEKLEAATRAETRATEAATRADEAAAAAADLRRAAVSQINDAYDEQAGAIEDFLDEETGIFDTSAYITAMQAREQALRDYQSTLATSGLSPEAQAYLQSQGEEAAAKFLAGYKSSAPDQQAELDRIWSTAAAKNSGTYGDTVKDALATAFTGYTINGPTVKATVAVDRAALDAVLTKQYKVVVDAVGSAFGKPIK